MEALLAHILYMYTASAARHELLQLHAAPLDLLAVLLDAAQQPGANLAKPRRFQRSEFFGSDGRACKHQRGVRSPT